MKNVKLGAILLGLLAAASGGAVAADDSGLVIGLSAGLATYSGSCKGELPIPVPCDDQDPAGRGFIGWAFNKTWSLEVGWAYLGRVKGGNVVSGVESRYERETEGYEGTAVFAYPLSGDFHILGRYGAYSMKTTVDINNAGVMSNAKATTSGPTYGLGLGWGLGTLGVRGEWQRYQNVGNTATGKDDIDVFSLGLIVRF